MAASIEWCDFMISSRTWIEYNACMHTAFEQGGVAGCLSLEVARTIQSRTTRAAHALRHVCKH